MKNKANKNNNKQNRLSGEFANHPIKKFFFDKPLYKFIFLILFQLLIFIFEDFFENLQGIRVVVVSLQVLVIIYFVLVIVRVAKRSLDYLMSPKHIPALIGAYALFVLTIIILFSMAFDLTQLAGFGHLRNNACTSETPNAAPLNDPYVSNDYFYFSAITFFTVGYGDICPVGFSKFVAIMAAFAGHIVSVIIVALIINNYLMSRRDKKN